MPKRTESETEKSEKDPGFAVEDLTDDDAEVAGGNCGGACRQCDTPPVESA